MATLVWRCVVSRLLCVSLASSVFLVLGCDGSPSATPEVRADSAAVIRAALEYVLQIDSVVTLETRVLPSDSLNVWSPYSERHGELHPSDLLVTASAGLEGVRLFYPSDARPDSATIVSLSTATINGDRTFVFVVHSSIDPRWGYSAHFRRLRLEHSPRGWKVVDSEFAGQEN